MNYTASRPWIVFFRAEDSPAWTQIAEYRSRFEAENHAEHLKNKVIGTVKVAWSEQP